jgi:hypothetical protein
MTQSVEAWRNVEWRSGVGSVMKDFVRKPYVPEIPVVRFRYGGVSKWGKMHVYINSLDFLYMDTQEIRNPHSKMFSWQPFLWLISN